MEAAVPTPGGAGQPVVSLIPPYNPHILLEYLVEVLKVTLGARDREIQSNGSLLSATKKGETLEKCRRFASSSETSQCVIYVIKEVLETEEATPDTTCMSSVDLEFVERGTDMAQLP